MGWSLTGSSLLRLASAVGWLLLLPGCGSTSSDTTVAAATTIRVTGSDTMENLAKAWGDTYGQKRPHVRVQVSGGRSGVDGLANKTCELAEMSRKLYPAEIVQVRKNRGVEPVEHVVAYDCIGVYVNKGNPLDSITIKQLAEIYGDGGTITKWSQLGVTVPKGRGNEIVRVGRQSGSGTYHFFRETVLEEERDYKPGALEQNGSKEVVALVARTPAAIGYSGMGYKNDRVKVLKIARTEGEPGVEPTVENAGNGSYPITRPLQIYTVGQPSGEVKKYLDWILSPEGQQVVVDQGYVPVTWGDAQG